MAEIMNICSIPQTTGGSTSIDTGGNISLGAPTANGITSINHTQYMQRRTKPIKYIIIHYAASTSSNSGSADRTRKVLDGRHLSCDYTVDDTSILQFAPDVTKLCGTSVEALSQRTGGGVAPYNRVVENRNSLSIETSSNLKPGRNPKYPNTDGWYFTDATLNNLAFLLRKLMKEYNIPKSNIVRHFDCSGKACPGIIGWNTAQLYDDSGKNIGTNNESKFRSFINQL